MASISAMMKDMAKDQTDLRQKVEEEKEARLHGITMQQGMAQQMHQLTQMFMKMQEDVQQVTQVVTQTKMRADSRSRDMSTSRTFRRSDSTRGRNERSREGRNRVGTVEEGEPTTRKQRTQIEGGEDRTMTAAIVSSDSE